MGFTSTVLPDSYIPHFCGTRIPIRLTIYFKMVRSWHLQLCFKSMEHGLPNSAVNHGSLSEISPRGKPWSQKAVSVKTRAQPCAVIDSRTAARCNILLKRSTNTRIPLFLCASSGFPKTKSIKTDCQHSAGIGRCCSGARVKDWASPVGTIHKHECTCARTDTGGASKSRDLP